MLKFGFSFGSDDEVVVVPTGDSIDDRNDDPIADRDSDAITEKSA